MSLWRISGNHRLHGRVNIQGAKNSVLPILAACVISPCETVLTNCPRLRDVSAALRILQSLGCRTAQEDDTVKVDTRPLSQSSISEAMMREMRSSVLFLGALLARNGETEISAPGGCAIGERPIDLHLAGLRALGAEISEENGRIRCRAEKLRGTEVFLDFPSVGATENLMLAACRAEGTTKIHRAAQEPEIEDLQEFLQKLGARVSGAGSPTVTIEGFSPKACAVHRVMPDRMAAATFLCAAAATGGTLSLVGARPQHCLPVCAALEAMGCRLEASGDALRIAAPSRLKAPGEIVTAPYPGFPTDAQPLLMAAALKAEGETVITETVFENRWRHVPELQKLGADIRICGKTAHIRGKSALSGGSLTATDLRGAAAEILAALGADGTSTIQDAGHLARGYEDLAERLSALGAELYYTEND